MLLGIDFESYYDSDYSLSKMDPPSYILDLRWETIGCSFKEDDNPAYWVDGPDVGRALAQFNPAKTTSYAFNALFDNCIASWQYNWVPARMYCTMRLAVATRGHMLKAGASLRNVAKVLELGEKGYTIENARGKRRADLMANPVLWKAYQDYANNDNELNFEILLKLIGELPEAERKMMDRVLRCAVVPRFQVDVNMLQGHTQDLEQEKINSLRAAGMTATEDMETFSRKIRANASFVAALEALGVEVEYKVSPTNPEVRIPAFAKTDDFMVRLTEHSDPTVQALACARLGLRSTIEQTRGARILNIALLSWPAYRDGNMPIPLKYSGAHTHRLSGDWKLNMQNLPSGRGAVSKLRKALRAPPGYKVVVVDKSQIECRINAYVCGQQDLVEVFRNNGDPYSRLATDIFQMYVDKHTDRGLCRFIGKTGVLGLGFGCGKVKFYHMVVRMARGLGMNMDALFKIWTPELAEKAVQVYRRNNRYICYAWKSLETFLGNAWLGLSDPVEWGGAVVIGHGYVEGPNGLKMHYGNPRWDNEDGIFLYDYGNRVHHLYGPKLLENIVQFLARGNTMNDALRIYDRTGHHFVMQSHDELAWIVPEAEAENHLAIALEEMRRPPSWAPDIPLNTEGKFGDSYGDAK